MRFRESNKIVSGIVPVDINGGQTADYVCFKNYNHVTIIVTCGSIAGTCNLTVYKATDASALGATAFSFDAYAKNANINGYNDEDSTSTDTLTEYTGASGTIATGATSNQMFVIEIDAQEIRTGSSTAYDWIALVVSDPSASNTICATYIMSEPRYADAAPPTAIA
ncbi:MAG: hypothetical protein ACFFG0_09525 [Candidatus Thorarchaeota archaeon]